MPPQIIKKNLIRALARVFALIFLSSMASGNCVDVYMMVSKYWFPDLVLGKGPTQSTNTRLKGSSSPGIVWRGKNGIF